MTPENGNNIPGYDSTYNQEKTKTRIPAYIPSNTTSVSNHTYSIKSAKDASSNPDGKPSFPNFEDVWENKKEISKEFVMEAKKEIVLEEEIKESNVENQSTKQEVLSSNEEGFFMKNAESGEQNESLKI